MSTLKKIGRILVIIVAILVIAFSAVGIIGAWWVNSAVSSATVQLFSTVNNAVEVVDTGVGRVNTFVTDSRAEVQQAETTINTISANLQENSPVLAALTQRLQERLQPTVDKIREVLTPVRNALVAVDSAVEFANSVPFISERAPRLEEIDQALDSLEQLSADIQQLSSTLQAMVVEQKNQITQEATTVLTDLTTRIDTRLGEIESTVQTTQSEITALQERVATLQAQLLQIYNVAALILTLLLIWLIYSQVVVLRHHWRLLRTPPAPAALPALETTAGPAPALPAASEIAEPAAPDDTPPA